MTKCCKISMQNPALNTIVIDFDGIEIQFTGKYVEYDGFVYVEYNNGNYSIVEKPTQPSVKKEIQKTKELKTKNKMEVCQE